MITIKMIEQNGVLVPSKQIPEQNFGTMCDGLNTIVFETKEEAEQLTPVYPDLPPVDEKVEFTEEQLKILKAKLASVEIEASQLNQIIKQ